MPTEGNLPVGTLGKVLDSVTVTQTDSTTAHREVVVLGDPTTLGSYMNICPESGGLEVITQIHRRIHDGDAYSVSVQFEDVADAATAEVLIKVGANKELHININATASAHAHLFLFENPTVTGNGTAVTAYNHKRESANTSDATTFHTPSTSADGTQLWRGQIASGKGNQAIGGPSGEYWEWNLKKSEDYLIRLTNDSGGPADLTLNCEWYEE